MNMNTEAFINIMKSIGWMRLANKVEHPVYEFARTLVDYHLIWFCRNNGDHHKRLKILGSPVHQYFNVSAIDSGYEEVCDTISKALRQCIINGCYSGYNHSSIRYGREQLKEHTRDCMQCTYVKYMGFDADVGSLECVRRDLVTLGLDDRYEINTVLIDDGNRFPRHGIRLRRNCDTDNIVIDALFTVVQHPSPESENEIDKYKEDNFSYIRNILDDNDVSFKDLRDMLKDVVDDDSSMMSNALNRILLDLASS